MLKLQATERQVEYIEVLANKLGWTYDRVHMLAHKNGIIFSAGYNTLNRAEASKVIELLLEVSKVC